MPAFAQTPGTIASNPFPNGITQGAIVGISDLVALPNSSGARARTNSAAQAPDGRFFIVDQRGPVYSLSGTTATPFLNLSSLGLGLLNDNGERGLATIAFHPQYTQAGTPGYGKFYLAFSTTNSGTTPDAQVGSLRDHDEAVYEFTNAIPLSAANSPAVAPREVLRIARPASNHNGGQLGFNPNAAPGSSDYGLLYISTGDSGGGGDPQAVAQNNGSLMGKILRINPLGTGGGSTGTKYGIASGNVFAADGNSATLGEIYATGFRNPQRFSWDRVNGKLYAGDVGQGKIEEIDVVTNGANYGWGAREGRFQYVSTSSVAYPPNPENPLYTQPIFEYDHDEGSAVSGGFVYRGTAIPALTGKYVFGDLVNGRIFYGDAEQIFGGQAALSELRLTEDGVNTLSLLQIINQTPGVTATRVDLRLGQDALGNLYVMNKQDGIVRVLIPEPGTAILSISLVGLALMRSPRRGISYRTSDIACAVPGESGKPFAGSVLADRDDCAFNPASGGLAASEMDLPQDRT
jgi:glucose/arabinose dehydrogenase